MTTSNQNIIANCCHFEQAPAQEMFLNDVWSFYFHDPYSSEWDIYSYDFINNISTIQDFVRNFKVFEDIFHKGMFFFMREHITPRWEDEQNVNGGCFSIKVSTENLIDSLFKILSDLFGENMAINVEHSMNINGVSISPKKNSHIIRIWIKDSSLGNKDLYNIKHIKYSPIIYKQHKDCV